MGESVGEGGADIGWSAFVRGGKLGDFATRRVT